MEALARPQWWHDMSVPTRTRFHPGCHRHRNIAAGMPSRLGCHDARGDLIRLSVPIAGSEPASRPVRFSCGWERSHRRCLPEVLVRVEGDEVTVRRSREPAHEEPRPMLAAMEAELSADPGNREQNMLVTWAQRVAEWLFSERCVWSHR